MTQTDTSTSQGVSGSFAASYDIENRLIEVGSGGSVYGQYAYNQFNQRVRRLAMENGQPSRFTSTEWMGSGWRATRGGGLADPE